MEKCFLCNNDVKIVFFSSTGYKLTDGKYICLDCSKKYEINPSDVIKCSCGDIKQRIATKEIVVQGKFNPAKIVKGVRFGFEQQESILEVDENAGLINLPICIYGTFSDSYTADIRPIDKIIDFDLLENGNKVTDSNSLLGAAVGGALFGGFGAVVGAGARSKNTKDLCKSMKIKVVFDDLNSPAAYIDILGKQNNGCKSDSNEYKNAYSKAQECLAVLSVLLERNKAQRTKKAISADDGSNTDVKSSVADEIMKFKNLFDIGAITQEEFNAKKKQLLGL